MQKDDVVNDPLTSTTVPHHDVRHLATLRPRGLGRFFLAAFLIVWCAGWAVGEVLVLSVLGSGLAGLVRLGPVTEMWEMSASERVVGGGFLLVWLAGWTVGGIAALSALANALAGREAVFASPLGLRVDAGVGPFRQARTVSRASILGVTLMPDRGAVVVELVGERWRAITLGTADERAAIVDAIRAALGPSVVDIDEARRSVAPADYRVEETAQGTRLVSLTRRWMVVGVGVAVVCGGVAGGLGALDGASDVTSTIKAAVAVVVGALLVAVGARRRAQGFLIHAGQLSRINAGLWASNTQPLSGPLTMVGTVDSDGDSSYALLVRDVVLLKSAADPSPCLHLGAFLAHRLGQPLHRAGVDDDAKDDDAKDGITFRLKRPGA